MLELTDATAGKNLAILSFAAICRRIGWAVTRRCNKARVRSRDWATQCVMEQRFGIVALQLMAATPRSALDKQREKEEKDAPVRAARTVVLDEPELGPSAFSVRMGNNVVVWAHAGDTAMVMRVAVP